MSSDDDWVKMQYTYTMKYSSAVRKYKTLPFAAIWIDLTNIMLSEISQMEKNKNHTILLPCGT